MAARPGEQRVSAVRFEFKPTSYISFHAQTVRSRSLTFLAKRKENALLGHRVGQPDALAHLARQNSR